MNIHADAYNVLIPFGRYKDKSLGYVLEFDRKYLQWLAETDGFPEMWKDAAKKGLAGQEINDPKLPRRPEPSPHEKAQLFVVNYQKGIVGCRFKRNDELKERFKRVADGVQWNKDEYWWEFNRIHLHPVLRLFKSTTGLVADSGIKEWFREVLEHRQMLEIIRKKTTSDINVPGLLLPLYDYQLVDIEFGLAVGGRWINADAMGLGKEMPLDAKILTPDGWRTMGDINVGDFVIGKDGNPTEVLGVFPQGIKDIYRVIFSDGSSTECGLEHVWSVNTSDRNFRRLPFKNLTLKEIIDSGLTYNNGNNKYFIPMVSPVKFNTTPLPLDPYVLGVLIGDGCVSNNSVSFSSVDEELIEWMRALLPHTVSIRHKNKADYRISRISPGSKNEVLEILRTLNLDNKRSHEKFIPYQYKFSSIENRLALLQGLMDTDGWCDKEKRNSTHLGYCTTSLELANDMVELVQSFGGTCKMSKKTPKYVYNGVERIGKIAYILTLSLPDGIAPFRLTRKSEQYKGRYKYKPSRAVLKIDYVGKKEAQCIKVASPDGLYISDDYIVTHNTPTAIGFALLVGGKALIICPKGVKIQWAEKILQFAGKKSCVWGVDGPEGDLTAEFHIINYDNVNKFASQLIALGFNTLICDEATKLKNHKSIRTKTIFGSWKERNKFPGIKTKYVNLLTGTPLLSKPVELFTLLSALDKKRFNNPNNFITRYQGSKIDPDPQNLLELHERAKELMIRHTKDQVATELQKGRFDLLVEITPQERKIYNKALTKLFKTWKLTGRPSAAHMPALRNLLFEYKFPRVIEFAEEMVDSDRSILIFTIQQEHAERIAAHFGANARLITGKVSDDRKRRQFVQDIIDGKAQVMVMTIIAGGMGVDGLQHAISDALFVDRWFIPGDHEQAEDRITRKGQKNPTQQWYITVPKTFDEDMAIVLAERQKIIDEAVEGKRPDDKEVSDIRHTSIFSDVVRRMMLARTDFFEFNEVENSELSE